MTYPPVFVSYHFIAGGTLGNPRSTGMGSCVVESFRPIRSGRDIDELALVVGQSCEKNWPGTLMGVSISIVSWRRMEP